MPNALTAHDTRLDEFADGRHSVLTRFKAYTKAMMAIEAAGVATRAEADKLLAETEPVSRQTLVLLEGSAQLTPFHSSTI